MKRSTRALAVTCALTLFMTAACGDDDDTATADAGGGGDEQAADGDLAAYCDLIEELDTQDGPPTEEQMTEIKELRPDTIGAEIDMVADAFIEAEGDIGAVFADPEIEEAFGVIETHDEEACGFEPVDEGDEVNPEFADYCAKSDEINEQDGPPTPEQIDELVALAPEEIAEPAAKVAEIIAANDGDIEAIFEDPEGGAAITEIETFESENCGGGEDGEDGDLEAAEGAEVVPVVGVDFEYEDVPESVTAGPVAFEFTNEGEAIHEAVLFALDGKSVDEIIADAEAAFEADEDDDIGELGFAFAAPGGPARYINAELEPGEYVFICFIPGPEGKHHYELGMQQTFSVG